MNITRYKYPVVHRGEDTLGYNYTDSEDKQRVMIQLAKELAYLYNRFDLLAEIAVYYEGHDIYTDEQSIFLRWNTQTR